MGEDEDGGREGCKGGGGEVSYAAKRVLRVSSTMRLWNSSKIMMSVVGNNKDELGYLRGDVYLCPCAADVCGKLSG